MQFIIPMAGSGTRFLKKGLIRQKPFIKAGSKTFIEGVVNQFTNLRMFYLSVTKNIYRRKYQIIQKNLKQ